ncbi:hypothetical protein [Caballeronia sp. ATUFL_M2_KS44]|uniref:hypothetical protein n=1 Tax=Caballeronia sp. ATUFL_M2_KS44 TaxID=2921767 RepID=UPI002027D173|nr:hypothetical protein [Caballeronia sp. ATUFL_M2_KS44]
MSAGAGIVMMAPSFTAFTPMHAVFVRRSASRKTREPRKPPRGTLARYRNRIVEVLGEARGERVMIRSIHDDGIERRTAVKWASLLPLDTALF